MTAPADDEAPERLAIIGMACRLPGADSPGELWQVARQGVEAISRFDDATLAAAGVAPEVRRDPAYVPARGVIDGIELFDADFFGLTPREAELMDPQQRLFLECCAAACEHAGYDPHAFAGRIGVYGGAGFSSYLVSNLLANPDWLAAAGGLQTRLFNDKDFLTTQVSYRLDLRGPAVTVQTACSTSLVALHLACQALLEGECDMALAGGATATFPHRIGYLFQPGGIGSPDGHCRAFDARAAGTVEGNGAGAVLVRRLESALAAGDTIQAVVLATAINNDGAGKAGYTAPSVDSQTRVVIEALRLAGVAAGSIGYVEAHGSGTPLGDPIEVEALSRAFRGAGARRGFCALGSVKPNLGHADTAAGVASLIKTVQALRHRELPPLLHFANPNPAIDLPASPFFIPRAACPWPAGGEPRRAGINSLGIGGTNAHVVLEEAPPAPPAAPSRRWQMLLLSARTATALERVRARLADFLAEAGGSGEAGATAGKGNPAAREDARPAAGGDAAENAGDAARPVPGDAGPGLAEVAHTLRVGRRPGRHRLALVCGSLDEARRLLADGDPSRLVTADLGPASAAAGAGEGGARSSGGATTEGRRRQVAFLLPGLGDQAAGATAELYACEPAFRAALDRCAELALPHVGADLRQLLYPAGVPAAESGAGAEAGWPPPRQGGELRRLLAEEPAGGELERTALAHPAVFAVEYALAALWRAWGIVPQAMLGYSLGELVAACLAEVLSLPDAVAVVAARARLVEELPAGALLAVPLPAEQLAPILEGTPGLSLAAANGPQLSVAGGAPQAVADLARQLAGRGIACRRVAAGHAFHTEAMRPAAEGLARLLAGMRLAPPRVPFVSNRTGTWISDGEATDPAYWAEHLCRPVRFAEGLATLLDGEPRLLVEVGPGQALLTLARQHPARQAAPAAVASLPDRRAGVSEQAHLLDALSRLWLAGAAPDWNGFVRHERRRRVPLPTYPFERRRYFIEPAPAGGAAGPLDAAGATGAAGVPPRRPLADWLYAPTWERTANPAPHRPPAAPASDPAAPATAGPRRGRWLLLLDDRGVGERLAAWIEAAGGAVSRVRAAPGQGFAELGGGVFAVDPGDSAACGQLLGRLRDTPPQHIVHLFSLGCAAAAAQQRGFDSLMALARAFGALPAGPERGLRLTVATDGLFQVAGGEPLSPAKATLLGPCLVLPQELPGVRCTVVELSLGEGSIAGSAPPGAPGGTAAGGAAGTALDGAFGTPLDGAFGTPLDGAFGTPLDGAFGAGGNAAAVADALAGELLSAAGGGGEPVVALRGRRRWVRRFRPLALPAGPAAPEDAAAAPGTAGPLRRRAACVVAGGLTDSGLAVAEHLFATAAARLALLVPPDTPPRGAWAEWLGALDESDPAARRLRRVLALEAAGCELLVVPVELAHAGRVAAAVERARERFGEVHAVFNAAFTAGAGLLQWKTREQAAAVLAPAVDGTLALAAATRGMALDCFVLFGSNTAAVGGFGQSDTAAAAAFLDAFAQAREGGGGAPFTQAIDWGLFTWQPVTVDDPAIAAGLRAGLAAFGIDAADCARALDLALASGLPQVTVSTQDLGAVSAQLAQFGAFSSLNLTAAGTTAAAGAAGAATGQAGPAFQGGPAAGPAAHPRPELPVAFEVPADAAEQAIAAVWREAFGLDRVGRHDNFFDLGGNSLLAIQIVTRLAAASGIELSMANLLAAPTVAELALLQAPPPPAAAPPPATGAGADRALDGASPDDLERLLAEIEALGEAGAAERLAAGESVIQGGRA